MAARWWILPALGAVAGLALLLMHAGSRGEKPAVPGGQEMNRGNVAVSEDATPPAPRGESDLNRDESPGEEPGLPGTVDEAIRSAQEASEEVLDEQSRLAGAERILRKALEDGWEPPFADLAPSLSAEDLGSVPTADLVELCFTTDLVVRSVLLHDDPAYGFKRLETLYEPYAELFKRPDLGDGVLEAFRRAARRLDSRAPVEEIGAEMMLLGMVTQFYSYPPMRTQIKGREREFLEAQVVVLKSMSGYIQEDELSQPLSSVPHLRPDTADALVKSAVSLAAGAWPSESENLRGSVPQVPWGGNTTIRDVKAVIDGAVSVFEALLERTE